MKTLKEILAERKRAAQSTQVTAISPSTDNHVAEPALAPAYAYSEPLNEFYALFDGIEDF